ncbi:hypothetical protein, partial [uncultured Rikenella sp.]|uniref:hypothetical protein n=1 Tax=uncultured Rikenella sp. TaxID=368003 RepID=UPI00272B6D9D
MARGRYYFSVARAPPPKEGNRQNVLARFDKISPGARTKFDRARSLKKEIIQTRDSRLNKISASARTKNGGRGCLGVEAAAAKRSFARPRDVG